MIQWAKSTMIEPPQIFADAASGRIVEASHQTCASALLAHLTNKFVTHTVS